MELAAVSIYNILKQSKTLNASTANLMAVAMSP